MSKIAFFDIDGTLYGFDGKEHKIPESTQLALKKFRENGNLAFICTGRPMRFIYQIFGENMFDGYISANGTHIVYKGECIFNKTIDINTLKELIKSFDELGIRSSFAGPYNGYSYKMKSEEIEHYNSQFNETDYLITIWKIEDVSANTIDIFYKDKIQLDECKSYFQNGLIFNPHGPHMSADVSFKDFDKSDGIKYVVKALNIPIEDTIAFGDGHNDITMLKTVNTGIAMGNAVEELKNIASYVTENIFDDGLYKAMVAYEFIDK
ncbi:haloacid dehalogenase [Clostridium gelidum]|uniref:Haloacid dehalogenase n=1 Tax=Clostridium gelidum TaxID=704125 RepID=A0ABM7T6N3_9CLOT|nr:HAD family hydrolase [Clostridium gelidum]BCZ44562.1 haloacid dehalogenase [Clostridium gelidum]